MNARILLTMVAGTALAIGPAGAQSLQRRAVMTSGGSPQVGRCTGEVIVDGAAEIDIRGDMANMRDLSGRAPEWRSFECTGPLPVSSDLRFSGEGRGSERLIRTPNNNGGTAVVRIEDPEGGANVYRFELSWNNASGYPAVTDWRGTERQAYGRFGRDQAIQVCQDSIRQQAMDRFGRRSDVVFRRINMDDNPGRNDWVVGMIEIRRPDGDEEHHNFSCSVNFNTGRVRSANIEAVQAFRGGEGGYYRGGDNGYRGEAGRDMTAREMENCQQAIGDRIRRDGFSGINFENMNVGSRYGNDWVTGVARAQGSYHPETFEFSCSVNPNNGNIRSSNVTRR